MSTECPVVDDSAVVRKVAVRQQALDAVEGAMPRLGLLDRSLSVMDCFGFLRALRAEYGPDEPWLAQVGFAPAGA